MSVSWQSDFARDVGRPRNNSRVVRFYYPFENSHRLTMNYELDHLGPFQDVTVTALMASSRQRTEQERLPSATGTNLERGDIAANDFQERAQPAARSGGPASSSALDAIGRLGLKARDVVQSFDAAGQAIADVQSLSMENARRLDIAGYVQAHRQVPFSIRLSGGLRVNQVTTVNEGGFFGDRSTAYGAASGFGAITVPISGMAQVTAQLSRGFRDPTLSDRYFRGPSGRGFITGNPSLEPETSLQFDVSTPDDCTRGLVALYLLPLPVVESD